MSTNLEFNQPGSATGHSETVYLPTFRLGEDVAHHVALSGTIDLLSDEYVAQNERYAKNGHSLPPWLAVRAAAKHNLQDRWSRHVSAQATLDPEAAGKLAEPGLVAILHHSVPSSLMPVDNYLDQSNPNRELLAFSELGLSYGLASPLDNGIPSAMLELNENYRLGDDGAPPNQNLDIKVARMVPTDGLEHGSWAILSLRRTVARIKNAKTGYASDIVRRTVGVVDASDSVIDANSREALLKLAPYGDGRRRMTEKEAAPYKAQLLSLIGNKAWQAASVGPVQSVMSSMHQTNQLAS